MSLPIKRPYACPGCGLAFTKWGLCQTHLRQDPCRTFVNWDQPDALQEVCRAAARGPPQLDAAAVNSGSQAAAGPIAGGPISEASPVAVVLAGPPPPPPPLPVSELPDTIPSQVVDSSPDDSFCEKEFVRAMNKLRAAHRRGTVSSKELSELQELTECLASLSKSQLRRALDTFFGMRHSDFRWVIDKKSWLQRCCAFVCDVSSESKPHKKHSELLLRALSMQALTHDSLPDQVYDEYSRFELDFANALASDVGKSILANVEDSLAKHFDHLFKNRNSIQRLYRLSLPSPRNLEQLSFEQARNTLYCGLVHRILTRRRPGEPQVLEHLAKQPDMEPGESGSLLHTHLSLRDARAEGDPDVSALHAAAMIGSRLICARLLAEGLDVDEKVGRRQLTPLHVAAAHGESHVVELLLDAKADPWSEDASSEIPLNTAITAVQTEHTSKHIQFDVCDALLRSMSTTAGFDLAGDNNVTKCKARAAELELTEIHGLIKFHINWEKFALKFRVDKPKEILEQLRKLQYETACYVMGIMESHIKLSRAEAVSLELLALLESDYIQARDQLQRQANRLRKKVPALSGKCGGELMFLPPAAGNVLLSELLVEQSPAGTCKVLQCPANKDDDEMAWEDESSEFLKVLRSTVVQQSISKGRSDRESFLRVTGLRARSTLNRKDEATLKKEIERRMALLISKSTTPLTKRDFDFRVRKFFHELSAISNVCRVSEVLAHIESAAIGRRRDEVRVWTAYIGALVKRFDPKIYQSMVDKDNKSSRVEKPNEVTSPEGVASDSGSEDSSGQGRSEGSPEQEVSDVPQMDQDRNISDVRMTFQ